MTLPDEMLRELLQTFQVEAGEHLQTLNVALLALEVRPEAASRQKLVQEAFRAAHSLKGAARAVDLDAIEQLAHSMENILQQARDTNVDLSQENYDVLYDVLDAIGQLLEGKSVAIEPFLARMGNNELPGAKELPVVELSPVATPPADDSGPKTHPANSDATIRVALDKLDNLTAQIGELLVSKMNAEQQVADLQTIRQQLINWPRFLHEIETLLPNINDGTAGQLWDIFSRYHEQFQITERDINCFDQHLRQETLHLGAVVSQLQDSARHVRMIPFETLAPALQRTVRDAAHLVGKPVAFHVLGGEVELDKKVLETLKDPFVHLLRNAVDHGIETAAERERLGKPAEGQITLTVRQHGAEVRISLSDDGAGFDLNGLRQAVHGRSVQNLDDHASQRDLIELAFLPGVTTSREVSALSGRGVGLDVVRQSLGALQGRVEVDSVPGKGTNFDLVVPSTLTISRGLVVQVGNDRYVLPLLSVLKIIEPRETFTVQGQTMINVDGNTMPLVALANLLECPVITGSEQSTVIVVMAVAEQRLALLVDDVITEQELAVKPLRAPLRRVRNVAGAALMGDGKPVVILNAADLVRAAKGRRGPAMIVQKHNEEAKANAHILVVDDSITTRTLEKHILETAGYDVTTATDGEQALLRLKEQSIDLVVSDVQMPNMDGIALTRYLRGNSTYKDLPLILVTSLESQEDRERGMVAGANAYIVKRSLDQADLLKTVQRLVFLGED